MNIQEYINSGILELYLYGALTEEESEEVKRTLEEYPEAQAEVVEIEKLLLNLSAAAAPGDPGHLLGSIKSRISGRGNPAPIKPKKTNWPAYIGWAASLFLLLGLFFMFNRNHELRESLRALQVEKTRMESGIAEARGDEEETSELLAVLRGENVKRISLQGQETAPDAFAIAWWDPLNNRTYIDAKNLPEPPPGMVYQAWSLKLQPFTPTSIGLLQDFEDNENKIFQLQNTDSSEGFGITLEPEGGSETPTMERLYTLGTVSS